jgi:hypothetical protein
MIPDGYRFGSGCGFDFCAQERTRYSLPLQGDGWRGMVVLLNTRAVSQVAVARTSNTIPTQPSP